MFCGGCNFRCPNCHNRDLVLHPDELPDVPEAEIWSFLAKRHGLLDGVVISGGEPTLQADLGSFAERLHQSGFLVKLDTNGYRPDVLRAMIDAGFVDYVAMDVKAPPSAYALAAGVEVDVERIQRSIDLLLDGRVTCEFRTTIVPGLLEAEDVIAIARWVGGARRYCLQQFVPRNTLDPEMTGRTPYSAEQMRAMAESARQWVEQVDLRGV
jgi:pyruvate formate lyase activating enzyme